MSKQIPAEDLIVHLREAAAFHALNQNRTNSDDVLMRMAADEIQRLLRGEYICRSCGLRKDGEIDVKPEF